jgi:hypothetical protein
VIVAKAPSHEPIAANATETRFTVGFGKPSKSSNTHFESTRSAGPTEMLRIDAGQLAPTIIVIGGLGLLEQNFLIRACGAYFAGDRIAGDVTR